MNSQDVPTITTPSNGSLEEVLSAGDEHPLLKTPSRLQRFRSREHGKHPNPQTPPIGNAQKPLASHLGIQSLPESAEIALAALQFLPTPVLVLCSSKTILVANEAFGRLVGLGRNLHSEDDAGETVTEILGGQSLSQIGLDMISDGIPVWVSWEKFLDNLASGASEEEPTDLSEDDAHSKLHLDGWEGPDARLSRDRGRSPMRDKIQTQDTVVDVIVSTQQSHYNNLAGTLHKHHKPRSPGQQTQCRMIISNWWLDDQQFFTLTFTSAAHMHKTHAHVHVVPRTSSVHSKSAHSSYSQTPASSRSSSVVTSPSEISKSTSIFPPPAAPAKCLTPNTPSATTDFQKITRMKDAMLGAMHIPVIAMWKDESVVFPNQAARRLLRVTADPTTEESYDFMSRFKAYTPDFERELEEEENPIIKLCRTQTAFEKWEIGLINEKTNKRSTYDLSGYPVFDDKTSEFFAALVAFKDTTEYTERIATQHEENEQQFQLMCNSMPQLLWTTRPDGYHDWFSERWYAYTGLKPEQCRGFNWRAPFHPEDMPESIRRWQRSLATGEEYSIEYRCRSHEGQWRWMLGRALPLRDSKSGAILKWYGSCTDIQATVDARMAGQRAREQLLEVLRHAEMTMWTINPDSIVTFFEGNAGHKAKPDELKAQNTGLSIYEVFKGLNNEFMNHLKAKIQRVLSGVSKTEIYEIEWDDRWFRSRLMPLRGRRGINGVVDENAVEGVVGISTDVTELKKKEHENIRLLANESAAKEASKMKSSFLANMSHEIRTPIAGVLGMSELLLDTRLDQEQSDFALNIQRSANSLLTVINDILDFSKIESGRLDIEEVQFSLDIVLKDVAKMLSFAAERKRLHFISDIQLGNDADLILLGDPGRVRQILTNLLTNSIKFTSDGSVKLSAQIVEHTNDTTTVQFQVADTGIGIEEEVKKKLFKPFSQADSSTARRFGGTGLGLTISKNLVDLMHGSISLESKLDNGTVATFSIPFKKPEYVAGSATPLVSISSMPDRLQSEMSFSCNNSSKVSLVHGQNNSPPPQTSPLSVIAANEKPNHSSPAPGKITASAIAALSDEQRKDFHILVVEDNPVNQQIALRFIKSLKFSVNAVWNGQEALEYLLKAAQASNSPESVAKHPIPSLILMDVQMPVLDGYHCTHMLRHHAPYNTNDIIQRIPIVAMTASAIQGDREKCERAGMDDYMAKPVKKSVLEKMIIKWLTGDGKMKKSSDVEKSHPRPDVSRTGTDHSSNCPGGEVFPQSQRSNPLLVSSTGVKIPSPTRSTIHITQQLPTQVTRRSSLSRTILASQVPGVESEADRGLRWAEAEEHATFLRDAKLMAATDAHGSPDIVSNFEITQANNGSPLEKLYQERATSAKGEGVMALTEENVERLNADQVADEQVIKSMGPPAMAHSRKSSSITGANVIASFPGEYYHQISLVPPVTPPEISSIDNTSFSKKELLPAFAENSSGSPRNRLAATRKSSDWSNSTAKP